MEYFVMDVDHYNGSTQYLVVSLSTDGTMKVIECYEDENQAATMVKYLAGGDVPDWMVLVEESK
jgi:hypothetical protein